MPLSCRAHAMQANPGFLRAAVVRSDADALLLPLLRTLHECASPAAAATPTVAEQQRQPKQQQQHQQQSRNQNENQSQSQNQKQQQLVMMTKMGMSPPSLYVPAIVVLLFSQDAAFDRQSFRQVRVFFGGVTRLRRVSDGDEVDGDDEMGRW